MQSLLQPVLTADLFNLLWVVWSCCLYSQNQLFYYFNLYVTLPNILPLLVKLAPELLLINLLYHLPLLLHNCSTIHWHVFSSNLFSMPTLCFQYLQPPSFYCLIRWHRLALFLLSFFSSSINALIYQNLFAMLQYNM